MSGDVYRRANEWLKSMMDKEFASWLKTTNGIKWQIKNSSCGGVSPYEMGLKIPFQVSELIDYMDRGDEHGIERMLA